MPQRCCGIGRTESSAPTDWSRGNFILNGERSAEALLSLYTVDLRRLYQNARRCISIRTNAETARMPMATADAMLT